MEFLSSHKRLAVFVASIILVLTMIVTAVYQVRPSIVVNALGYVITPLQKGTTDASAWVSNRLSFFRDKEELLSENERLQLENENLRLENQRLKLAETENEKLSALLDIRQKYSTYPSVAAETIAKDPGNWFDRFIIDKGTDDGLATDMVVMGSTGLIGRISDARSTYSHVTSLINDTSSISAKCIRTNDLGIVKGDMDLMKDGLCRMDYLDMDAEVLEGDEIVTSQISGIYPPGIVIGLVKEVRVDARGLTKTAIIQPLVDFKRLETVLVITETFNKSINYENE